MAERLSRRDRQREAEEAQRKSRRRAIALIAVGGVGTAAAVTSAVVFQRNRAEIPSPEFSGTPQETARYLKQWDAEVKRSPQKLEGMIQLVASLASAYFANRMSEYTRGRVNPAKNAFAQAVQLLDGQSFKARSERCAREDLPSTMISPAFISSLGSQMYLNRDYYRRQASVLEVFIDVLHEIHHLNPPIKDYTLATPPFGVPETIVVQRGLAAFAARSGDNFADCLTSYRDGIDEIVSHDSFDRMARDISLTVRGRSVYEPTVERYRREILEPYAGGDFRDLLYFQQTTDPDGFFELIGRGISPSASYQDRLMQGTIIIGQRFRSAY